MKRILAFVFAVLFSAVAVAVDSAHQSAPPEWQYVGMHSYEQEKPGLGVSHRYRAAFGWADVYIYSLQHEGPWAPGVSDPAFDAHFKSTIGDVQQYAKSGDYADLRIGEIRDMKISGHDFRTIQFQFVRNGRAIESATYLTAANGRLLKYRMSFFAPVVPSLDEAARKFVEQSLRE